MEREDRETQAGPVTAAGSGAATAADDSGVLVSVIIPTRDRPRLARRAVASVLDQTYAELEVIVIDDGSQAPFSPSRDDPRLKVIRHESSRGGAAARNAGFDAARGSYVCLLDDDDYYLPHKIAEQFAYLRHHSEVDMVFSRVVMVNEQAGYYIEPIGADYTSFDIQDNFRRMNMIHTNATMFRKRVADAVRFDERLEKYQDTQFHLAAAFAFRVAFLPGMVAVWNVDDRNDRLNAKKSADDFRRDYESFRLICEIFSDAIRADARVERAYYHRLAFLGMRAGEFAEARRLFRELGRLSAWPAYLLYLFIYKSPRFLAGVQKIRLPRHRLAECRWPLLPLESRENTG
ncbi:MAG: glycosyltransferase family 2 protein [Thermoleophilia bacterium]